jgi:hypothetical protein
LLNSAEIESRGPDFEVFGRVARWNGIMTFYPERNPLKMGVEKT